jgi:hypothetical protein
MKIRHLTAAAAVAFGFAAAGNAASAADLVDNSAFNPGLTGWTWTGQGTSSDFVTTYDATGALQYSSSKSATLSQEIATTPGHEYLVTFELGNTSNSTNSFNVSFGGTTLLSLTDAKAFADTTNTYSDIVTATSAETLLSFTGTAKGGSYYLVDPTVSAVPVPPALIMFGAAIAGLGFFGWQRNRSGKFAI